MRSLFITGAAGGIGQAVIDKFLSEGWLVGAYDVRPIERKDDNLVTGILDVTDPEAWGSALAEFAEHTGGGIDVVDNNAGILVDGSLSELTPEGIKRTIDINCLGVTLGAHAAYPYLKKNRGQLLNMASAAAIYGQPGIPVYSASKFYVSGLTEALRNEWRADGIRVVDVWPLWVKTPLANTKAKSTKRLGVRINPPMVADVVWKATHPKSIWERGNIRYGVSTLDKLARVSGKYSPYRVGRIINAITSS